MQTLDGDLAYAVSPVGTSTTLTATASADLAPVTSSTCDTVIGGDGARFDSFGLRSSPRRLDVCQSSTELVSQTKFVPGDGRRVFTGFGVQKPLGLALKYGASVPPVLGSRFH